MVRSQPTKKEIDAVGYADQIVDSLLQHSSAHDLELEDVVRGVVISLEILKAIYPDPERLFEIMQEAEGEFQLYAQPTGDC